MSVTTIAASPIPQYTPGEALTGTIIVFTLIALFAVWLGLVSRRRHR